MMNLNNGDLPTLEEFAEMSRREKRVPIRYVISNWSDDPLCLKTGEGNLWSACGCGSDVFITVEVLEKLIVRGYKHFTFDDYKRGIRPERMEEIIRPKLDFTAFTKGEWQE